MFGMAKVISATLENCKQSCLDNEVDHAEHARCTFAL